MPIFKKLRTSCLCHGIAYNIRKIQFCRTNNVFNKTHYYFVYIISIDILPSFCIINSPLDVSEDSYDRWASYGVYELNLIMTPFFIVIGIIVFLGIFVIALYNNLVTLMQRVKESWADIDVQLKRRYELIPNLVNTVKGSSNFESSTLEKVVEARSKAMGAGTMTEHKDAENQITGALKSIFALAESYPDLKSNQNYLSLQSELADTENKIQAARRFYNSNVMAYNTKIATVPANIIAKRYSFTEKEFFELAENEEAARNPVEVKF